MHIDVIENFDGLKAIRGDWDAVYEADPDAHLFLSWEWLAEYLGHYRTVWFVLAAKSSASDARYGAFFPMRLQTNFDRERGFSNELYCAGVWFSDYTGILARPEVEEEAVTGFADYIRRKLHWSRLTLDHLMMSERRRRLFLRGFKKVDFTQRRLSYVFPHDPIDHGLCPSLSLPASWSAYLETLSVNNRQKIRRLLKKVDPSDTYGITVSEPESIEKNLAALLDFWKTKWRPKKGEDTDVIARNNMLMLSSAAASGRLFLPVFRHGERLVAAHASLIDTRKRALLFFITGRDESYREMPAGYLLHAYSIRHAIAQGFATYDFLRGNEAYKYQFGARDRPLVGVAVRTKTKRNLGGKLDPRGLPAMLKTALDFENKGEDADAGHAYREILELEPSDALALYRYGRFLAKTGDHAKAVELYSRAVERAPTADNAWFFLAQSHKFLGETEVALKACRKVLELRPEFEEAKALLAELSFAPQPVRKLAIGSPAAAGRPARPGPVTKDRHVALQEMAAASLDPDWLSKQLAAQAPALPGPKHRR
jgi:tetratricopeptide (TPR) repeat protein